MQLEQMCDSKALLWHGKRGGRGVMKRGVHLCFL